MKRTPISQALLAFALGTAVMAPALAQHAGHAKAADSTAVQYRPDYTFTLRTDIADGKLVFVSETGALKGVANPTLNVPLGAVVQINLVNGDGATHDISVPDFAVKSNQLNDKGASTSIVFKADKKGVFTYICSLPGHVAAGMIGKIVVGGALEAPVAKGADVSQSPIVTAKPIGARGPQKLTVNLETTEVVGQLADGTTYKYWTYNNKVPGPFLRVRVGDTVDVNMSNAKDSHMIHSVDFHAVTGPGGGAAVTQAAPGSAKSFTFKALNPGLRDPDGGPAYLERHVRHDPGRAGRRLAQGRPRVLRDAGRALYGAAPRHPGRSRVLARKAARREAGAPDVQR